MSSNGRGPLVLLVLQAVFLAGVTGLAAPGHGRSPSIPANGVAKASGPHRLIGLRRKGGKAAGELLEQVRGGGDGGPGGWGGIKLSPATLVATFTMVNMLNYMDRGLVNGVLPHLGEDFQVCFAPHTASCAMHSARMDTCLSHGLTAPMHLVEKRLLSEVGAASRGFLLEVPTERSRASPGMQVSKTSLGLLTGTFMAGYCVLSPIFAHVMPPPRRMICENDFQRKRI